MQICKLMVLEPVRLAQQGIQHRRFFDVREDDAEMRAKLPVARAEQKRLDMLAGRRLLKPADHRALPAVLGGVQNRQRFAPRPVAQQQRRAKQILPMPPAMHVHRPRDRRLDLRPLGHEFGVDVRSETQRTAPG